MARFTLLVLLGTVVLSCQVHSASDVDTISESDELRTLEEILVIGQPIENYRATDALTSTKSGALLKDLPISATVIPQQLIKDRQINFLGEALDNVSGAQRKLGYGGTQNFGAYIRGFDAGFITLRNGFRDYGFYTMRDTANVERFEVLKGPASILYGALQPGGITNTITKRPVADPMLEATALVGSDGYYRGQIDAGGEISGNWYYRANVAYEDSDSYRDLVTNKSWFIAPVITWVPSERTRWTLEAEFKHSEFTWDLGLPRAEEVLSVPPGRFLGEADELNEVDSFLISSVIDHEFNSDWTLRQRLQFSSAGGDYYLRSPLGVEPDGRTVTRVAYTSPGDAQSYVIQHDLVGNLSAFGMQHQSVVGVELYKIVDTYDFIFQPLASIDLFAPEYGAVPDPGFPLFGNKVTSEAWAVYAQDLVTLTDKVKLLAGIRYDDVQTTNYDRLAEQLLRKVGDSAVSSQVGVVFQPFDSTSLYLSYSTSFLQNISGRRVDGSFLDPEKGEQYEAGIKQEFVNGKLGATLAFYTITKDNVSAPDLANPGFSVQVGQQKSRGAELELAGSLLAGWDAIFNLSYIDAYVSRDTRIPAGTPLENAPKWSGSLWTKYDVASLPGFSVGLGLFAADERVIRDFSSGLPAFSVPSYARLDAMIGYDAGRWAVQLNGRNLSNERIYDLTGTTIMPQEPRAYVLSLRVNIR